MRFVLTVVFVGLFVILFSSPARAQEQRHTNAPSLATSGLIVFGGTYGYAATVGATMYRMDNESIATKMFIPVAGPWLLLKDEHWNQDSTITGRLIDATRANRCDASVCAEVLLFAPVALLEYGMLIIDPIAQAAGIVMMFVGATRESRDDRRSPANEAIVRAPRPKVSVKPSSMGAQGAGLALSITEW